MAKFNFSRFFAGFMNCKRHKIKILSPLGKRADPRASRICQILSPLGFFDSSASRICSRIPLGMTLGSPRFLSRTPLVSLSDTLVRPSDARWDLENPRGLKSAEMEPWRNVRRDGRLAHLHSSLYCIRDRIDSSFDLINSCAILKFDCLPNALVVYENLGILLPVQPFFYDVYRPFLLSTLI